MARRNLIITDPISNENTNFSENYTKIPSEDNAYPVKSPPTELPYVPHIGIGNHTTYDEDDVEEDSICMELYGGSHNFLRVLDNAAAGITKVVKQQN